MSGSTQDRRSKHKQLGGLNTTTAKRNRPAPGALFFGQAGVIREILLFLEANDGFGGGFGFGGGQVPEAGHGHDEFDGDLGFAHEGGTDQGHAAEQFFAENQIFEANDLLDFDWRGEQQERAVLVDDDGVGLLGDGVFAGVLKADADRHPGAVPLAAPAILRKQIGRGHDSHKDNVAKLETIPKKSKKVCALGGIAASVTHGARMPVESSLPADLSGMEGGGRVDELSAFAVNANSRRIQTVGRAGARRVHPGRPGAGARLRDSFDFDVSQAQRAALVAGKAAPHRGHDTVRHFGIPDAGATHFWRAGLGLDRKSVV